MAKKTTDMGWPQLKARWQYTPLDEPALTSELARLAAAESTGDTDTVSFQPCPNPDEASQDRLAIHDWLLPGGVWSLRAVFDGHAGHDTATYTANALPMAIHRALTQLLAENPYPEPLVISDLLRDTIVQFDQEIGDALLALFPNADALAEMSQAHITSIIDDPANADTLLRCMRGTTVLVALTDPSRSNIWVASLGDCIAVLGTRQQDGNWISQLLSVSHNGANPAEAQRVREHHPNEPSAVQDDRVLGAIAVTRAIGDYAFKLPAIYTHLVFMHTSPGFLAEEKVRAFTKHIHTPPYVSNVPDVTHTTLTPGMEKFIMLCSDGLYDLYEEDPRSKSIEDGHLASHWVNLIGEHTRCAPSEDRNLALAMLRAGLGGTDTEKVSRMINVEMLFRWMDDTTVVVQRLL